MNEETQLSQNDKLPPVDAAASGSGLWSIHISGPDEYHAKASKAAAEKAASEFNAWFDRQPKTENTPHMVAAVQPWPFDAASHADALNASVEARQK